MLDDHDARSRNYRHPTIGGVSVKRFGTTPNGYDYLTDCARRNQRGNPTDFSLKLVRDRGALRRFDSLRYRLPAPKLQALCDHACAGRRAATRRIHANRRRGFQVWSIRHDLEFDHFHTRS